MNQDDRQLELLEELVAWTKFAQLNALIAVWRTVLADDKHLIAYELTDGSKTQRDVAESSGLSQPTISSLWQKWRRNGLARELPSGKVRHLARPSDFGVVSASAKKMQQTVRSEPENQP
jgi:CRP-like cAMP-binding protein